MTDFDLYPHISSMDDYESLRTYLPEIIRHPRLSALRLSLAAPLPDREISTLSDLLRQHDVALILAPTEALKLTDLPLTSSDGVHFTGLRALKTGVPVLKQLTLQIGCTCETLDDAMYAGESGADYITLPAHALEAIEKWSAFAELPCVAEGSMTPEDALKAVQKGADFISFPLKGIPADHDWIAALTR